MINPIGMFFQILHIYLQSTSFVFKIRDSTSIITLIGGRDVHICIFAENFEFYSLRFTNLFKYTYNEFATVNT